VIVLNRFVKVLCFIWLVLKECTKPKSDREKSSVYMAEKKGSKAAKIAVLAATKQAESNSSQQ
jgi:hypothetical protein